MSAKSKHNKNLISIIKSPYLIEENKKDIVFILQEPIWLVNGDKKKMADIIFGFRNYIVPVEVKGTPVYRNKAIAQIRSTTEFAVSILRLPVYYGKIAYYSKSSSIEFEVIE